jgi:steroid 5-alpha-reductase/3-oxo-5-alpha-steroid 4-dehydrogenase 1
VTAGTHVAVVLGWTLLGAAMLPVLLRRTAPYGRHAPAVVRLGIPSRAGWMLMEAPSVIVPALCFAAAPPRDAAPWVMLALWEAHYVNRTFVHPLRMRGGGKPMPLSIVASALLFTTVNGYLNGRAVTVMEPRGPGWLSDPRFLAGAALFALGMAVNLDADRRLYALRRPGETGYAVPEGGLFRLVSCPNYLGETIEWGGWALLTWSLAGASFLVWTVANLLPRALAHHRFYRERFPDYPADRRAIVPFVL